MGNYVAGLSPSFNFSLGNDISDPKKYPGISIYESKLVASGTAITLPGVGILIHPSITGVDKIQVLQHEYGHFLDYSFSAELNYLPMSPSSGFNFYMIIGIPSLFNASTGLGGDHNSYWTEVRANQWVQTWFGDAYIHDEKHYPTK